MTLSDKIKVNDDYTLNMYMKCYKASSNKTKCPYSNSNCEGSEECHVTAHEIFKKIIK